MELKRRKSFSLLYDDSVVLRLFAWISWVGSWESEVEADFLAALGVKLLNFRIWRPAILLKKPFGAPIYLRVIFYLLIMFLFKILSLRFLQFYSSVKEWRDRRGLFSELIQNPFLRWLYWALLGDRKTFLVPHSGFKLVHYILSFILRGS